MTVGAGICKYPKEQDNNFKIMLKYQNHQIIDSIKNKYGYNNTQIRLISLSIEQAILYLSKMNMFYPFGTILTNTEEIKPISVYDEDKFPDQNRLLSKLTTHFELKTQNNEYLFSVLCVNVHIMVKQNHVETRKNALEIKCLDQNNCWQIFNIPYLIQNHKIILEDMINNN